MIFLLRIKNAYLIKIQYWSIFLSIKAYQYFKQYLLQLSIILIRLINKTLFQGMRDQASTRRCHKPAKSIGAINQPALCWFVYSGSFHFCSTDLVVVSLTAFFIFSPSFWFFWIYFAMTKNCLQILYFSVRNWYADGLCFIHSKRASKLESKKSGYGWSS